jgi:hypothetical protein
VVGLLKRFFKWYGPWFNAYSFVLARAQEYEADRVAADLATPAVMGSALVRIELQSHRFSDHWVTVCAQSRAAVAPTAMPYTSMRQKLGTTEGPDELRLKRALSEITDLQDTHPSLSDRLSALSASAEVPPPLTENAAQVLLGPLADQMAARFDQDWWAEHQEWWETCHSTAQVEMEELPRLKAAVEADQAGPEDIERFIEIVQAAEGDAAAIAARREIVNRQPDLAGIRYQLGIALLDREDHEGIAHVEAAIASCPALGTPGYRAIVAHLRSTRTDGLDRYLDLVEQSEALDLRASEESRTVDRSTTFKPLSLDADQREDVVAKLQKVDGLKWIVAGQRWLELNHSWQIVVVFSSREASKAHEIVDEVIEVLSGHGDVLAFSKALSTRWLVKRLEPLQGVLLLAR